MPLTPATVTAILYQHRDAGISFGGPTFDIFAQGFGVALSSWAVGNPLNLALTGQSAGTAGVGVVSGTSIFVPPNVGLTESGLAGAGIQGVTSAAFATFLTTSIVDIFANAQYVGASPQVATGIDISLITTANAVTLEQNLLLQWGTRAFTSIMARGVASSVTSLILGAQGSGNITGASVVPPAPAIGFTNSVIG